MQIKFGSSKGRCRQRTLRKFVKRLDRGMNPSDLTFDGIPADWVVCEFSVNGQTRRLQEGDIPGDMFAIKPMIYSFIDFTTIPSGAKVVLAVQYIGDAPSAPFSCVLQGRAAKA